jgi:hypothetical protein
MAEPPRPAQIVTATGARNLPCTAANADCSSLPSRQASARPYSSRSIKWHRCGAALEGRVGPDLCHMGIRGSGAGLVPRPFGDTRCAG